jgi:hypothetical protein
MKKVLQIIMGQVPEHLQACVDSVKAFAARKHVDYVVLDKSDLNYNIEHSRFKERNKDHDEYLINRLASEFMRVKYLAENPETLYVDWDIFLYKGFEVPEEETFGAIADSIIYNGMNTQRYLKIYEEIKDQTYKAGRCVLAEYLWPLVEVPGVIQFDRTQYRHLFECNSRGLK